MLTSVLRSERDSIIRRGWKTINQINSATFVRLSQAKKLISNSICCGIFFVFICCRWWWLFALLILVYFFIITVFFSFCYFFLATTAFGRNLRPGFQHSYQYLGDKHIIVIPMSNLLTPLLEILQQHHEHRSYLYLGKIELTQQIMHFVVPTTFCQECLTALTM